MSHRASLPHLWTLKSGPVHITGVMMGVAGLLCHSLGLLDWEISWFVLDQLQKETWDEGQHYIWSTSGVCEFWLVLQSLCRVIKVKCLYTWTLWLKDGFEWHHFMALGKLLLKIVWIGSELLYFRHSPSIQDHSYFSKPVHLFFNRFTGVHQYFSVIKNKKEV